MMLHLRPLHSTNHVLREAVLTRKALLRHGANMEQALILGLYDITTEVLVKGRIHASVNSS